jgi:hypothetical protein
MLVLDFVAVVEHDIELDLAPEGTVGVDSAVAVVVVVDKTDLDLDCDMFAAFKTSLA